MKIAKELKAKWLAALRSGDYKQGKNYLHNSAKDTFCCLGVLCEVAGIPRRDAKLFGDPVDDYNFAGKFSAGTVYSVPGKFEMKNSETGDWPIPEPDRDTLIDLNDNKNWDFQAIANWIEANIETF